MSEHLAGFNGRVPRNDEEAAALLLARPSCWEYIFFAYHLKSRMETLERKLSDLRIGYAVPGELVPDENVIDRTSGEIARVTMIISLFDRIMSGRGPADAFGEPGESGNQAHIIHLAQRQADVAGNLVDWALGMLSLVGESEKARDLFAVVSRIAVRPIETIQDYVNDFYEQMDGISARIANDEDIELQMVVEFDLDPQVLAAYNQALESFVDRAE